MFLATTAVQEFWDKKKGKIFISGEWCRLYKENYNVELKCLPYQWDDYEKVYKAQIYCAKIFESTIVSLTSSLNAYLGLDKEEKYYRILLGSWLIQFIHQAYDKEQILKLANKSGATYTWTLNRDQYYYPFDYLDFSSKMENDLYQLQMYSQIARYVKFKNFSKRIKNKLKNEKNLTFKKNSNFKSSLNGFLKLIFFYFPNKLLYKKRVIIVNPYFKRHTLWFKSILLLKSLGRILFDDFKYYLNIKNKNIDEKFRTNSKLSGDSFEEWISEFAIQNIPQCYLEYHHEYVRLINNKYPKSGDFFLTFNDLNCNVPFQFFLAINYKKHIFGSGQHGNGYGVDKRNEHEIREREISNIYFTYGWKDSKQTIPLAMPKLINRNLIISKEILFLTSCRHRYLIRFFSGPTSTKNLKDHVENPLQFLRSFKNRKYLVIRHHPGHNIRKWNNRERIKSEFPDLKEDMNNKFYKTLESCSVYVADHFGTTFLEAMQSNVPCVIFLNKNSYKFRSELIPHINDLEKQKIIFYDPVIASNHLDNVINNLNKWWNNQSLQEVRRNFCKQYAYTSNSWIDEWINQFYNILK